MAAAVNVTRLPARTVWASGWVVKVGAVEALPVILKTIGSGVP